MGKRIYIANGFAIISDVVLVGWIETYSIPPEMIVLTLTKGEFQLEYDEKNWPHIWKSKDTIGFNWGNRLAFLIANYNNISYIKKSGVHIEEITYALNFALSFIAIKYGRVALHACVLTRYNDSAIMILGNSGSGKSTLLYNMLKLKFKFISEEICFAYNENKNSHVFISNRIIRLNRDIYKKEHNDMLYYSTDKVSFWNNNFVEADEISDLKIIIVLNKNKKTNEVSMSKINKSEMIGLVLKKYLYTRSIIKWFSFSEIVCVISELVRNVDCYLVTYPSFLSVCNLNEFLQNQKIK